MQARGLRGVAADPESVPGGRLPASLGAEPCLHSHVGGHRPLAPRARLGGTGRRGGRTVLQPLTRGGLPAPLGAVARLRSQPRRERLAAALARTRGLPGTGRRSAAARPGSGRGRHVARADGHGRDEWAVELPRSGQQLLELLTATPPAITTWRSCTSHIKSPLMRGWPRNSAYRPHIGAASASGSSPSPPPQRASSRFFASSSVTAAMLPRLPPPPEKRTSAVAASHRSSSSHTACSANSSRRPA